MTRYEQMGGFPADVAGKPPTCALNHVRLPARVVYESSPLISCMNLPSVAWVCGGVHFLFRLAFAFQSAYRCIETYRCMETGNFSCVRRLGEMLPLCAMRS